ncbi:MAG: GLPGLI family protein [Flavisolibacter sp.]|nr:GLPGLI family protein [Flavisolibacter sp.]
MRNILFTSAMVIFAIFNINAQQFQGMAVYESKTSTSDFKNRFSGNKDITPEMQKNIEERMKKMFEKTFILNFDKTSSVYYEEEKLEAPGQQSGGGRMMAAMMGGGGTYYKDVKKKMFAVDKEFMGKEFLIKDSLPKYNWKMESETRQIGGYTCYKATAVVPAAVSDFRNFRPKSEKKDGEKPAVAKEGEKTLTRTNFLDEVEMPKEINITAWYAPEIPVNQGPEGYWGLPGLILEVNDGKTTILCSKIVLNVKEKAAIKEPSNGKVVGQKEYDEIVVRKMEEMQQMYQQGGQGRGGERNIRIGG